MNRDGMMEGMNAMGGMMWGMGIYGLLTLTLVILLVAALVKYLFFGRRGRTSNE